MRRTTLLLMLLTAVGVTGCAHTMDMPEGFVPVDDMESGAYAVRGVSADGMVVALKVREIPKESSLGFWTTAVTNELVDARGYVPGKTEDVTSASGVAGRLLSFTTEQKGVAFTYMVVLLPNGRKLLLAEAGGKSNIVNPKKDAILKALLSAK